ncbi:MAG: hypothetical protein WCF85_00540 [Rhodospirillaceae bacterium]
MTVGINRASTEIDHVSDKATVAGAALGGVAGTMIGGNAGLALASHLGLCALGSVASCGLLIPLIGTVVGGVAAREWIEGRIETRDQAIKRQRRKAKRKQTGKKSLFSFTR